MQKNIFIASISIIIASIFFVINDAIINYLSVNQIQFYHFVFYGSPAYLIVPLFLYFNGDFKKHLSSSNYYILLIRSLLFAPMPFLTFIALKNISLPEFTTLNMAAPLFASIYAYFFLNEKFNRYLYLSLFIGFLGVIFVVQPGFENFNIYFLVVLFGVILITSTTTIVNKFHNISTALGFFIYGGSIIHILSFLLFIYDPIKVDLNVFILITIASILINIAIFLATFAVKKAQKHYSSVFCLVYLQILWSSIIGYFIFNEYLNTLALLGALFIIISGLISIPGQFYQLKDKSSE